MGKTFKRREKDKKRKPSWDRHKREPKTEDDKER